MHPHYRDILRLELDERITRNPRYTLRSFARDLNVQPSTLSEVLKGKHGLSLKTAHSVCEQLGFSDSRTQFFLDLVESQVGKDAKRKAEAQKRLDTIEKSGTPHEFDDDSFRIIADWYHLAILEMAATEGFVCDPILIAKKLAITPIEAEMALKRFHRLGMVQFANGKYVIPENPWTLVPTGVSPKAMKLFYKQIMAKTSEALENVPREKREFRNLFIAVSPEAKTKIRERMHVFFKEVEEIANSSNNRSEVYNMSVQFFPITEN